MQVELTNVKFINFSMQLDAIIRGKGYINLLLKDVDFISIVPKMNSENSALIKSPVCSHEDDGIVEKYCGQIIYNGGVIKLISNGYELFNY